MPTTRLFSAVPLYFVKRLAFSGTKELLFAEANLSCQFFPISDNHCDLIANSGETPFAGTGFRRIMGGASAKVTGIDYVLAAVEPENSCLVFQSYRHKFKKEVRLSDGAIVSVRGPLFETHPLNFLLGTKKFGGLIGVQFAD